MVEFGMAFRLSDQDKELVKGIFEPIEEALMLTNDYWSWDREYEESMAFGNRLVNAVEVVRKTQSLSVEEAQRVVRDRMVACENAYVKQKSEFYQKYPDVSINLKRWVEVSGCIVSGSHYWASSCARHHRWHQNSIRNDGQMQKISDATSDIPASDKVSVKSSTPAVSITDPDDESAKSNTTATSVGESDYGSAKSSAPAAEELKTPDSVSRGGGISVMESVGVLKKTNEDQRAVAEKETQRLNRVFGGKDPRVNEEISGVRGAMNQLLDALEEGEKQVRKLEIEKAKLRSLLEDAQTRVGQLHQSSKVSFSYDGTCLLPDDSLAISRSPSQDQFLV
jgi:hypothetical protein